MSYDPEEPEDDNDAEQHRMQAKSIRAKVIAEMGEANYKIICKRKCNHYAYREILDAVPRLHAEILCYLIHKSSLYRSHIARKGWFYNTMAEMIRDLRLSRSQQTKCIHDLKRLGVIKVKMKRGRRFFKIDYNQIAELILEKAEMQRRKGVKKGGRFTLESIQKKEATKPSKNSTIPFSTYKKGG